MKLRSLAAAFCLGMIAVTCAVAAPHGTDFKELMQKEFDAWSTMDMDKVAPFYAQGPDYVFYDLTPLKYTGWDEYAAGVKKAFPALTSIKFTINDDVRTHLHGNLAWGTATVLSELVTKAGQHEQLTARWTVIWEKRGKSWLIVHEHFSAPVPQ